MLTRKHKRNGLILLVVLGMLALFSILTVSYVVFSSNSNKASAVVAQVKLRQPNSRQMASLVLNQIIRGTTDPQSAFFAHDLLGDVYGNSSQIYGRPSTLCESRPIAQVGAPRDGVYVINSMSGTPSFLKIPLNPAITGGTLSTEDDAYNGRLFTFLGGPLKGKTFRIMHYIGDRINTDPDYYLRFSVLLSLTDLDTGLLTERSVRGEQTRTINDWLTGAEGTNVLGYSATDYANSATYLPYRYLINDAPYTGVGFGLSLQKKRPNYTPMPADDPDDPEYGNLGQTAWLIPDSANPQLPANLVNPGVGIPVGLLHQYNDPLDPIGMSWRQGDTNEGIDVADHRDLFLSYQPSGATGSQAVIPSFHRPEVINHLVSLYGDPSALSTSALVRMLNLIDYACARPLSITLRNGGVPVYTADPPYVGVLKSRNIRFRTVAASATRSSSLDLNLDNWPAAAEVTKLQNFVSWLINGDWDVDNDGDGIKDSMWLDPNLPLINGPDGKLLKVMVSARIEELDSRINLTTAGDLVQTDSTGGYEVPTGSGFVDPGVNLSQGFGYGPAEISFASALQTASLAAGYNFRTYIQSYFDQRNGYDDFPGMPGNDPSSTLFERESAAFHQHGALPGIPLSRRGALAVGLDRNGNPLIQNNRYAGLNPPSENAEDPYELRPRSMAAGDQPHSLGELERLIRRFDSSFQTLPTRLQKTLQIDQTYNVNSEINRLLTTRSAELRYPVMGAVGEHPTVPDTLQHTPGNMLGWVKLLHEQRFKAGHANIPQLTTANLRLLFPLEFRLGLKLDVNRALGNGIDDDGDGQIDEPQELRDVAQAEYTIPGEYGFGFVGSPAYLTSRQLLARQLYCLAQLIVPRDYLLPGMEGLSGVRYTDNLPTNPPSATMLPGQKFRALRGRILAQWAVNVVDFRDADVAMTRFPYDELPFGLDGADNGSTTDDKTPGWVPQPGRVVWGMEFPEMALSETFSMHDVRTKDTDQDNNTGTTTTAGMNPDSNQDQYRIPEGSFYVELVNLRTTSTATDTTVPGAPASLYGVSGGSVMLNIAKKSAESNVTWGFQPVWRIGISDVHAPGTSPNELLRDPTRAQLLSNQFSGELDASSVPAYRSNGLIPDLDGIGVFSVSPPPPGPRFDRMILFTRDMPTAVPDLVTTNQDRRIFYANGGSVDFYVPGGGYLVLGPRPTTYFGTQNGPPTPVAHLPSPQRILMQTNALRYFRLDGVEETPWSSARKNPQTMVVSAEPPSALWNDLFLPSPGRYRIGLNISEPLPVTGQYYPIPTQRLNPTDPDANGFPGFSKMPRDSWKNYSVGGGKTLPDKPFDDPAVAPGDYSNPVLNHPLRDHHGFGTHENVRSICLQRLADPDMAYDPINNPYITVDWMGVDLTVFNGEDTGAVGPGARMAFQSRYKDGGDTTLKTSGGDLETVGVKALTVPTHPVTLPPEAVLPTRKGPGSSLGTQMLSSSTAPLIETPLYNGPNVATKGGSNPAHFRMQMGYSSFGVPYANTGHANYRSFSCSTLGYLNVGRALTNDSTAANRIPTNYDGFGPPLDDTAGSGAFDGSPQLSVHTPFWLNRRFASPYELMLVTPFGPSQLQQNVTLSNLSSHYLNPAMGRNAVFGHLFNFFDSSLSKLTNPVGTQTSFWSKGVDLATNELPMQGDLHLLFDLVETPQAYVDSATYFNGAIAAPALYSSGNPVADDIRDRMLGAYKSPYNRIPSYVNSGKININGISSEIAWKAVESNYLRGTDRVGKTGNTAWPTIANSRRGYTIPVATTNPFFSNAAHLNPNLHPEVPTQFAGAFRSGLLGNIAIDQPGAQTLRGSASDFLSLFRRSAPGISSAPLMTGSNSAYLKPALGAYKDGDRQPFIAMQRLTRLANLVTQQSNVFAVHLTVGFFEYDPIEGIGREYEDFAGGLQRSRSMFILDRSIPVGYRVGEDINTENIILSSRFFD